MDLSTSAFKYLLLFVVIAGWFYYRFVRATRRPKGPHGRELWRENLRARRQARLEGAATWEERRQRKDEAMPQRRIASRFLRRRREPADEVGCAEESRASDVPCRSPGGGRPESPAGKKGPES